jgi:hypothetical protein
MISMDDPRWDDLEGGYRVIYDPRPALRILGESPDDSDAWAALWEELHHQGDVGEASYAAVPYLAALQPRVSRDNWQVYSLVALIEGRRGEGGNPPLPGWLERGYARALAELGGQASADVKASADPLVQRSALGLFALSCGLRRWGQLISEMSEDEVFEALGWE